MKLGKILCIWTFLVLIGSINLSCAKAPDERVIDLDKVPRVKHVEPKIESVLDQLHDVFTNDRGNMASFARQRGIKIHREKVLDSQGQAVWYDMVRVILNLDYSEENIENLESRGLKIEASDDNLVQALVPVSKLKSVSKLPFIKYVRCTFFSDSTILTCFLPALLSVSLSVSWIVAIGGKATRTLSDGLYSIIVTQCVEICSR